MNLTKLKRLATWMKCASFCLTILLLLNSCANITPKVGDPAEISFDGNSQNAGIVGRVLQTGPDGDQQTQGYEITSGAKDRFNAYVKVYGQRLLPPIKENFGVTPMLNGNFLMTEEAAAKWYSMKLLAERDRVNKSDTLLNKVGL